MIQGVPSFKGFHMTEKGKESLSNKPISFIEESLLPAAKMAKEDKRNCLSVEDDGRIYIETPRYGKFTVDNPSDPQVNGRYLTCNVRTPDGERDKITVHFPTEEAAKDFKWNKFGPGCYIPRMNLDLYKAIVAADRYSNDAIARLKALSDD